MAGGPTRERFADAQQAGAVPAHSVHEIALGVLSGERFLQRLTGQQQLLLLLLLLLLLFRRFGLLLSVRRFSLQKSSSNVTRSVYRHMRSSCIGEQSDFVYLSNLGKYY